MLISATRADRPLWDNMAQLIQSLRPDVLEARRMGDWGKKMFTVLQIRRRRSVLQ